MGKPSVQFLQYLLYGLNIPSAKSEINRTLSLDSISSSLTLAQTMHIEKNILITSHPQRMDGGMVERIEEGGRREGKLKL